MIRLSQPSIGEEELKAVCQVLASGMLIQGEHVVAFETALSNYTGAKHTLAVSSGTAALHLALTALGIGPGDAVFLPAFTFPAPANVVELRNARPVLVDVNPRTYCMTAESLREAINNWQGVERPRAIIVVHEFGAPCPMEEIMAVANLIGLTVVEDAACALGTYYNGRHVGLFGDMGCFSWHPRKALTTGEGGAVVSQNVEVYHRISLLRNHGMAESADGTTDFVLPGFNYRMTEFQAALGTIQLSHFPKRLEVHKRLAALYRHELSSISGLELPADIPGHSWQTFMVVLPKGINRQEVIKRLHYKGIETNLGAQAIHMLSYYRDRYGYVREECPIAAELFERGLALPLHSGLHEEEVLKVVKALKEIIR